MKEKAILTVKAARRMTIGASGHFIAPGLQGVVKSAGVGPHKDQAIVWWENRAHGLHLKADLHPVGGWAWEEIKQVSRGVVTWAK